MFIAQKKKQSQIHPVTPARSKQDAPLRELTDHELEQVVGGFSPAASVTNLNHNYRIEIGGLPTD
ncbi:MAG TPA: bacteriocin [Ktedonobacterales bacterium]|jgi:bacteriocin-like protein